VAGLLSAATHDQLKTQQGENSMSASQTVFYGITGFVIESGEPWTYWQVFAEKDEAIAAAKRMNNAKQPIVRGCVAVLAWPELIEASARQTRLLQQAALAEED
jgi:hypothetical protein